MKIKNKFVLFLLIIISFSCKNSTRTDNAFDYLYKDLPFEMPVLRKPTFPANTVSIADFGGSGDGITLNTAAFARAIDALAAKGGGTLRVPSGVWLTGPVVFKSNINLNVEKGALLLFSPDFSLYPLVETVFEGLDTRRCQSPISGHNLENIAITGEGAIDGSGEFWRPLKKDKVTDVQWESITSIGGIVKDGKTWYPSEGSAAGAAIADMNVPRGEFTDEQWFAIKDFLRPGMVNFVECKNVLFENILIENTPCWAIHPLMCENVIIDGVMVRNPAYAQNGDGIDLESCKNSIIKDCVLDVGDDAICIKSGKDADGRRRGRPTENLIVDNCKVFNGHGGFVVGSEMSGSVRNISVSNCVFMGTDVGLRFKSKRGRGGVVENIYVHDINMFNIATEPFLFDLYYGGKSAVEALADGDSTHTTDSTEIPAADETTPAFRNISVKNLTVRNARRAMFFNGLPEMPIENIDIENAFITATYGATLSECRNIIFNNVKIEQKEGEALNLNNVENIDIQK
ncbi:MAG: glycoside hydrolase family 28 protein [Prevotellaceae bacterium]|jgi:polygalacturonase|nr:glycoside hydrolase family 28 protein [Prevotellaceae bacterium]